MEKPNEYSSPDQFKDFAKNTTPEERQQWATEQKALALKEAEMLKNGGEYYLDQDGNWSFQFSDKQLEVMAEKARQTRIDRYFEEMGEEIQMAEGLGDEEEVEALKQKLASKDKRLVADAVYENGKWTITPKGAVVSEVKKVIADRKDFERAKIEFAKDVELRKFEHEKISEINWVPINFESNLVEAVSTITLGDEETVAQQRKRKGANIIMKVFETVSDYLKKNPNSKVGNGKILQVRDYEFGRTANNSDSIEEEHIEGLQVMLGMKLEKERIGAVHYAFSTDGKLNAIMMTLTRDKSIDAYFNINKEEERIREEYQLQNPGSTQVPRALIEAIDKTNYHQQEKDKINENPTLGYGSLIIKRDGKKMFLPDITYKQYPVAGPNGRFISTFAGGPSRGIFDEEIFFASDHMSTSTGDKVFFDESEGGNPDDYDWDEGNIERRSGRTNYGNFVIPPAHVELNKESGVLVYKLDCGNDYEFNGKPFGILEKVEK